MTHLGVAVELITQNRYKFSSSGVKLCDHFVLTHGFIVWDLLKKFVLDNLDTLKKDPKGVDELFTQHLQNSKGTFKVFYPTKASFTDSNNESVESLSNKDEKHSAFLKSPTKEFHHSIGSVERFLFSSRLRSEYSSLFIRKDSWIFEKDDKEMAHRYSREQNSLYFCSFLILRINKGGGFESCIHKFEKITTQPEKGTTVFIDGCPFGSFSPALFLNSVSKGIIGNVSPTGKIFLTDARCVLGCEGAPAYSVGEQVGVCGIVISSFCWLKGEWIGLTFMAAFQPLLEDIKLAMTSINSINPEEKLCIPNGNDLIHSDLFELLPTKALSRDISEPISIVDAVKIADKCIVRICIKDDGEWGTGVIVNCLKGIVVTCSHVLDGHKKKVHIRFADGSRCYGLVIYATNPFFNDEQCRKKNLGDFHAWDLAIIRILHPYPYFLPLSKELPYIGTPLLTGGYPMFREDYLNTPTFSLGNLAKVCELPASEFDLKHPPVNHNHKKDVTDLNCAFTQISDLFPFNENFVCPQWKEYTLTNSSFPVLLQTTCGVYGGVSGGPVIAVHPLVGPVVIGIVACCATERKETSFPHVNMAIPSYFLAIAIEKYVLTDDKKEFEILGNKSAAAISLWNLEQSLTSKL